MSKWKNRTLPQLADFINGYAFKPSDWSKEGLPIIRIEQLKNPGSSYDYYSGFLPARNLIENGDLIFSWSASLFLKFWSNGKAALNQHLFKVVNFDEVDKFFLKYLIEYNLPELLKAAHGSTMQHITRKELNKFRVTLPIEKTEQSKIAAVLSSIDKAIEQTEKLIEKQKRIKRGLLHDLLTKGVDENGAIRSEATHEFKDSTLGRIPKDWEVVELLEVVPKAEYGISESLDEIGEIPVLRMNNLIDGEISVENLKYSNGFEAKRILLKPNDILFNRTNSIDHVGKTAIWRGQVEIMSFASYLVRLTPNLSRLLPEFLNYWLNYEKTQTAIRLYASIAVHQVNINPTNLRKTPIALPKNLEEQNRIIESLNFHKQGLKIEKIKLEKLKVIKKGLMQDLLTENVESKISDLL